jgi:hypothetical protein
MGTRRTTEGATLYCFVVNGMQKNLAEKELKLHPGCYEALPDAAKEKIRQNRAWFRNLI